MPRHRDSEISEEFRVRAEMVIPEDSAMADQARRAVPSPSEPLQPDRDESIGAPNSAPQTARADFDALLKAREAAHAQEIAARDGKAAEWERAFKAAVRDRELATALAGCPLVPGAVTQLIKLWRDEFDVHEDRGEFKVSARDGRGVGQAIAEWLASPEFAHFRQPTSRGGTAVKGTNRNATTTEAPPAPKTLGEAIIARWQEAAARAGDTSSPIRLGRRR